MSEKAWLDISIFLCPSCGRRFADASWYVIELESDIECGNCRETFNAKKQLTDRVMLEFRVDKAGKALKAEVAEHLMRS